MPTPVSAARQCLTEESARALDDAVAVARRRGHAQTTSLHAVSALLALPSSTLRDACTRARSSAYSPRLQFRALELSVGVSLDRLPSSKTLDEPPVSNSLMAAIKRSQANQRRHPENFHFHQIHAQQQTTPVLRVELKHFILSILDDPIVSRVFGEAGFRSCDIKLAIVHPPTPARQTSPFIRTRCPPMFLCNLTDSDPGLRGFSFPFSRHEDGDENCRRIGEVLVRKSGKNPLLIGVCASEALNSFAEGVQSGKAGILPADMAGLSIIGIEEDISEFFIEEGSEGKLDMKFKEVGLMVEQCSGPGVVLNFGELKTLGADNVSADRLSFVVSRLTSLLELHSGKLWLIGATGTYEFYSKFLGQFPTIQKDWDLHLLPITSSKTSSEGLYSKSSLMGSFVPFGGFFAAPSELKNPVSSSNQCFIRCPACTEKYEQEVSSILKTGSNLSVAGRFSESLPSLQIAEVDTGKGVDVMKTDDGGTTLNTGILGLQNKWNEICQRLHHSQPFHKTDVFQVGSQVSSIEVFQGALHRKESCGEDLIVNELRSTFPSSCTLTNLQKSFPSKQSSLITMASDSKNADHHSKKLTKVSESCQNEMGNPHHSPKPTYDMNFPPDHTSSSSVTSVTTDLGLGTIYASTSKEPRPTKLPDHNVRPQHLPGTYSPEFYAISENTLPRAIQSSCSTTNLRGQCDPKDLKSLKSVLIGKVGWQDEAICAISQAVCFSRSGGGRHRGSNVRGDIWLTFLGVDKVGKKRIALALAEILYGSTECLITVDLGSHYRGCQTDSIFECEDPDYDLKFRGKTVVDYLAGELSRKPHAVIFLENIEKADLLVQNSLSQAIRTGKFPDSRGREISINNVTFVATTTIIKGKTSHHPEKDLRQFSEDMILAAKRCQMQILIGGSVASTASQREGMNVRVALKEDTSNPSSVNKRKLIKSSDSTEQHQRALKAPRSFLDLNVPVEEIEESSDCEEYDSDSISESSEAWLDDFLDQVDEKVVLKPFDFDALAGKIVEDINKNIKRVLGPEIMLEIDYKVMIQILAAAWLSEEKRAVEKWVEQVLCRGFAEAEQKYVLTGHRFIKLVASGPHIPKEQASCVCLPTKISLN
ncbi:protein SMAX1-LIKE 6-like [Humulus lupulus]|uniref:protein SMAX1-LIKE 6-like n=1 Tax=Humulus lupulus TaxID=3486 RepID=UPI002B4078E9|nr:protein SMAX1-LIKE 6-like [Humulus lupulus]